MDWQNLGDLLDGAGDPVTIPPAVRRQHLYVLGRTGSGKSTFLGRIALADIARGEGLLVLDPHGDLVEDIVDHCPDEQRHRLIYLDFDERQHPVPINMFECRPGQNKDTICSSVIGVFKRLYGDMWGPQLEDLLRSLTLAMLDLQLLSVKEANGHKVPSALRVNATLKDAHDFLFNQDMRRQRYPFITNDMVRRAFTDMYDNIGTLRGRDLVTLQQVKYSSSTTNKLRRFLLNPLIFDICCNRTRHNTIDLRQMMDERKILLVNLSKGKIGEDNSALLGSLLLSQLVVATLSRAGMRRDERSATIFNVIVDEFQDFATDSFRLLLTEARKYGVTLTIAHQHREQLDYETRGAGASCGSVICFRLNGADAEAMAREFDAAPEPRGWRYEPVMRERGQSDLELANWYRGRLQGASPLLSAASARLDEAMAERQRLLQAPDILRQRLEETEAEPRYEQPVGGTVANPAAQLDTHSVRVGSLQTQLDHAVRDHAVRQRQIGSLEDEIEGLTLFLEGAGARPRRTWRRTDEYDRIQVDGSYAEREREIANRLTQLANFTAFARLVDGTHLSFRSKALPPESDERSRKVEEATKFTARKCGVPSDQRASVLEGAWIGDVRREEAYEAELDDQPAT